MPKGLVASLAALAIVAACASPAAAQGSSGSSGSGSSGSSSGSADCPAGSGSASGSSAPNPNPIPWYNGQSGRLPDLRGATEAISHLTGPYPPNDTSGRFAILGTDLGITWDNGRGEVLTAFGDTFAFVLNPLCGFVGDWRSNVLLRSSDRTLANGMTVDSAPLDAPRHAKELIPSQKIDGVEITVIPTTAIAVGDVQYIDFMSVRSWGAPGEWFTNFAGLAYSTDNGENWTTDPLMTRPAVGPYANFQMGSYLPTADWIYEFGTPSGRNGPARLARFKPEQIRQQLAYEYWNGTDWTPGLAGAAAAAPVIEQPVSELSVAWNEYLNAYIALYTDATNSIVMRTAPQPWGPWDAPRTIVSSVDVPTLYGAYIHPWSSGSDLYYVASTWSDYNVMLLRTRLSR